MYALRPLILALGLGIGLTATAGTVIEGHDEVGGAHKIFIDGKKVRIEADDSTYMLVDLEKQSFLGVDPTEKRVVDLSEFYKSDDNIKKVASPLNVRMEKMGAGPKIAGFGTTHYRVSVNGTVCSDEYLSSPAAKLPDMSVFFATIVALSNPVHDEPGQSDAVDQADSVCASAEEQLNNELYAKNGIPLKVVSTKGEIVHEITRIRGKERIAASTFQVPKDYTRMTMQDMEKELNDAMGKIRNAPPAGHPGFADSSSDGAEAAPEKSGQTR
jgi:hypothetical protein